MRPCVDASVVVRLVLSGEGDAAVAELWRGWLESGAAPTAPALLGYEVTNALRRYVASGVLEPAEGAAALAAALGLGIELIGDDELHREALALADRLGLAATYDAHYLAVAERLGDGFFTGDAGLVRQVGDTLPAVHLVPAPASTGT